MVGVEGQLGWLVGFWFEIRLGRLDWKVDLDGSSARMLDFCNAAAYVG